MIPAIIEILLLLIVSCAIGLVFSWIYWRKKNLQLQTSALEANDRADRLEQDLAAANADLGDLKARIEQLEKDRTEKERPSKKAEAKERKPESETQKLEKEVNKLKLTEEELKDINELLKEELDARERELVAISSELEKRKISYYKQIGGKRYKALTLKLADESVEGRGDGRISMEDARKIFDTISDGKAYTQVEKETLKYLRKNYKWTESADELFRKKVRSWAAKGHILN